MPRRITRLWRLWPTVPALSVIALVAALTSMDPSLPLAEDSDAAPTTPTADTDRALTFDSEFTGWTVGPGADISTFESQSAGGVSVGKLVSTSPVPQLSIESDSNLRVQTGHDGRYVAAALVRTHQLSTVSITLVETSTTGRLSQSSRTQRIEADTWTPLSIEHTALGGHRLSLRVNASRPDVGDELQVTKVSVSGPDITASTPTSTCAEGVRSDPDCRVLTWSDEFNDTRVDPAKWRVRDGDLLGYDNARIFARNATEANGILRIQARRDLPGARPFSTGYLDTIGKFSQQYGRWEMRARLPTIPGRSRGVWPAFWLRNDQGSGESDIMEAYGGPTDRASFRDDSYTWTIHEDTNKSFSQKTVTGYGTEPGTPAVSSGYHVFAMEWTPAAMKFYFDDRLVGTARASEVPWFSSAFDGPMNIRLNLQIGSRWAGFPDADRENLTQMPANFDVDYVRVYR